mmetsp:Transcript_8082/g.16756  ORF Transcript_8082/g.16756 Transcript_8082/m.16756 type:complete len:85 (+) Transcript_8082:1622-1876(+)
MEQERRRRGFLFHSESSPRLVGRSEPLWVITNHCSSDNDHSDGDNDDDAGGGKIVNAGREGGRSLVCVRHKEAGPIEQQQQQQQ